MIDVLPLFTTLVLGLFAGSLLTEAMILVPYWRRMEPAEFLRLHGTLGPKLFRFFAPLTTSAVVLAVVTAVLVGFSNPAWLLTGVLSAIVLSIFFIYFRRANNRFATHTITAQELPDELARWSAWHWLRTGILIIAFASSIYGHTI